MSNTTKKIDQIIGEIEINTNSNERKTISQVIDILLKSNSTDGFNIQNSQTQQNGESSPNYKLDMNELLMWKDKNNQYYKVEYYRNIYSNRRFVAKFIVLFKRMVRRIMRFLVEPIVNEQNEFNASVTASINSLYNNETVTQEFMLKFDSLLKVYDNIQDELNGIKVQLKEEREKNNELEQIIDQLGKDKIDIYQDINKIKSDMNEYKEDIFDKLNNQTNSIEHQIETVELNFLREVGKYKQDIPAENKNIEQDSEVDHHSYTLESNTYTSVDYFNFENYFRGLRKDIKESQKAYVEYFINKGNILDLGCGRGEFLELMKENGIQAIGVDAYEEFVKYCNVKGFKTVKDDAVQYISQLNCDSVGGIFASQLVEHLETNQLIALCNDSYKKLIPGSYFIIETPNPTSLSIYTNGFYVDPSHNKPVHPKTLEYFLRQAGFQKIEIVYTEQSKVKYRLPLLEGENIRNLSEFNDGINCLSDIMFGSQDYAIIAQK